MRRTTTGADADGKGFVPVDWHSRRKQVLTHSECSNALARQTVNLRSLERTLCCVASVLRTRGLRGAYALLREVRVIGGLGGHELHRTLEQRHLDDRV